MTTASVARAARGPASWASDPAAAANDSVLTFNPCANGTLTDAPPSAVTVAQAISVLSAAPLPEAQALGAWLPHILLAEQAAASVRARLPACEGSDCIQRQAHEVQRATAEADASAASALARLAVDTASPGVYAMAVEACGRPFAGPPPGACQMLSLARWAELDPANAMPWFHLAGEAQQRGDAAGVREALHRASLAERNQPHGDALLFHATPALAALSEPERSRLAHALMAVQGGWSLPAFHVIASACDDAALRDANQRQLCDGLATVLVDRSRTMLEFMIGRRLATRLGWPDDRLQDLARVADAWLHRNQALVPTGAASCAAAARLLNDMHQVARRGETGLARDAAAAASTRARAADAIADPGTRQGPDRGR